MPDDIFEDTVIRRAFESAFGLCARPWGDGAPASWCYFERVRVGFVRSVEASPVGLYAPLCRDDTQLQTMRRFIDRMRRPLLANVRINLNPLEQRAAELVDQASACGYQIVRQQTHLLPIGAAIDDVRRNYNATKRYEALRDVKVRSSIVVADRATQLDDYWSVYAASLARWGRDRAVYPKALFAGLFTSPAVRFWMNYVEGRLACAMVVLYCRSYAFYWQGVANIDADQKPAYPVVKLLDAVIQHLVQERIPSLNLGASDGLPNVRRFKEAFGARPSAYSSLNFRSPAWRALQRARTSATLSQDGHAGDEATVHGVTATRRGFDGQSRLG